MDITITDEDETTLAFDLEGTSTAFANALRRTMIGGVPTLAVEDVRITRNNSGLFDEVLAHRLGMIPWRADTDSLVPRDECDCEDGCPNCTVTMALQKEGPMTVTAADITVPDDDVAPANPDTVIAELNEEAAIDLEADAVLGTGQQHAKWQAANAAYGYEDDTFHFTVESVSGRDPRSVVEAAITQLTAAVDDFEAAISETV